MSSRRRSAPRSRPAYSPRALRRRGVDHVQYLHIELAVACRNRATRQSSSRRRRRKRAQTIATTRPSSDDAGPAPAPRMLLAGPADAVVDV